jgi:hypothetical protein
MNFGEIRGPDRANIDFVHQVGWTRYCTQSEADDRSAIDWRSKQKEGERRTRLS